MNSIPPAIYLAPFQGITTFAYREVYSKHFPCIDKLFTPFFTNVQTSGGVALKARELEIISHNQVEVVPQVLSKDGAEMLRFIRFCHERGHREVNWNLGCPYPRVARKQRGSGLLPHPDLVRSTLDEVVPCSPIKLSVKCRLGYEDDQDIFNLLPVFNEYGISELTVHTRIGKQLYGGQADWAIIPKILENLKIPFVYNGDIFSVEDYLRFTQMFPEVKTLMIGRGLLTDPLLPCKIKGVYEYNLPEQQLKIKRFIEDLYLTYRKQMNDRPQVIPVLKELWRHLSFGFEDPVKVFNCIKKTNTLDDYESGVAKVFSEYQWVGSERQLLKTFGKIV